MYARVWEKGAALLALFALLGVSIGLYKNNNKPDMYHRQSCPRLGDYIATVLQVTRLTKSIIRISGGIGSDTYNSFKKARTCTLAFTIDW